ncbi:MAG: xanthine dehydrogenase family protein subunit M [Streptosporangiales bacterium]|nr:xanthine dehydrogenase family protein subunit M [Streptosporangiales bacterium]
MFPAAFDYRSPAALEDVLDSLAAYGDEAKVLAGGMSLIPMMKLRFASPEVLVDLGRVPGLDAVQETPDGLRIGALVRHAELEASELLRQRYPVMAAAAPLIADPLVRNRGTLVGSLAHADPAGDWGSVMLALNAEVVARSTAGQRVIPVREFFTGPFSTVLQPTEVAVEVRVPRPSSRSGGTYLKLERKVGDFATVGVAAHLELDNERIGRAGLALTAVGGHNVVAAEAEEVLAGAEPGPEVFAEAAEAAARAADPPSDVRGSADYKRQVVRTYVRRGLARSLELAQAA